MRYFRGSHVLAAAVALVPGRALAQHDHDHADVGSEKFGQVHFPTSCKSQLAPAFERGLALLHSFAYVKAATVFQEVSAKDPSCGLAQWGVAMTYFHAIWGPPTDDEFAAGRTAAQKAAALGAPTWKIVTLVSYRAARAGIITGILLAIARISGETAPLLFTALNNQFWSSDMNRPMANLPVVIFQFAMSPYEDWHRLAWGGAALITLLVLGINISARALFSRK